MANKFFYCGFIFRSIVDFEVDSNTFWNTQNAPATILKERFWGSMPPDPPPFSTNLNLHPYRIII